MIVQNKKICSIKLDPNELDILSSASDIVEKIIDTATDAGIQSFIIEGNNEDYSIDELSTCMVTLADLSCPLGKLTGYLDEL